MVEHNITEKTNLHGFRSVDFTTGHPRPEEGRPTYTRMLLGESSASVENYFNFDDVVRSDFLSVIGHSFTKDEVSRIRDYLNHWLNTGRLFEEK